MDSDAPSEPEDPPAARSGRFAALTHLLKTVRQCSTPLKGLVRALGSLPAALRHLPIRKRLAIPAVAGAVLLAAGGAAFGLLRAKVAHAAVARANTTGSAPLAAANGPSPACSGVVRDIYRQTRDEDPSVTLAEVRSEVASSGVNCEPVPELAAGLKDLSPACRDMVQYTFLGVRAGHAEIKLGDVRVKVVQKSVACERDRPPKIATAEQPKATDRTKPGR